MFNPDWLPRGAAVVVRIEEGAPAVFGAVRGRLTGLSTAMMQPSALNELVILNLSSGLGVVVGGAVRILFRFMLKKEQHTICEMKTT